MVKKRERAAGAETSEAVGDLAAPETRKVPRKRPTVEALSAADDATVDPTAVFIRGLPEGATDAQLRQWIETQAGPTVTCYRIRDDYGLAKFKYEADARQCLEELKDAKFEGSTLRFEAAKPKRRSTQQRSSASSTPAVRDNAGTADASGTQRKEESGLGLRDVLLQGIPKGLKADAVQKWIEEKLPGGCGIEDVRTGKEGADNGRFVVRFRREANARRAVEALKDSELQGQKVSASFRALEMSRQSAKGGRLIVRNLAFGATEKHVRKAFAALGELAEVHLPTKNAAGSKGGGPSHRGFGFVQYVDASIAERAVSELNGTKICGRGVAVDWAMDSKLYGSLLREQERAVHKQSDKENGEDDDVSSKKAPNDSKKQDSKKEEESDDDEEEEDDEEQSEDADEKDEDDEDDEDEEEEEDKDGEDDEAADEMRRMKKLLQEETGINVKADTKKEKKVKEKKKKDKDEKEKRKPGYDIGEGRTLFVRNCPFDATEPELRKLFGRFGTVAQIKMVADRTGQNAHSGSVFVKYKEAEGLEQALAVEKDADRKLKELSSVIKRSDHRDLAAVEGFGVSLRGRRLVLKQALSPEEMEKAATDKKPEKAKAKEERSSWMHLLHVGEINENNEAWQHLSKSEKRQRAESMKERKWRVNNSNFVIHPLRLSVRNLPRIVDATKLRQVLVSNLMQQKFLADAGDKKERRKRAEALVSKVNLVRDTERRGDSEERRSKGFGFMAFKDHRSAMASLELLNDNIELFGGGKRPIVEFAIEDKRKLRMQEELYQRHAHKLLGGKDQGKEQQGKGEEGGKGKGKGKGESKGEGKGEGKGDGKGKGKGKGEDSEAKKRKFKHKKKPGMSRGQKQREKRRQEKATKADKEQRKDNFEAKMQKVNQEKRVEARAKKQISHKRSKKFEPDAGPASKKQRTSKPGQMSDDFELRAMERFRNMQK